MHIHKLSGALLASLALAACGSSASSSSQVAKSQPATGPVKVAIKNFAFAPATITVAKGTKITFTNDDQTAHTATSTQKAFDTGTVAPGASKAVVVSTPGTYTYICQFHAFMHGTVIVK
jgi:plastocyanin